MHKMTHHTIEYRRCTSYWYGILKVGGGYATELRMIPQSGPNIFFIDRPGTLFKLASIVEEPTSLIDQPATTGPT